MLNKAHTLSERLMKIADIYGLGRLLQHVVTMPARDGHERDCLRVVADLLDEGGRLLDDFVETVLAPLPSASVDY